MSNKADTQATGEPLPALTERVPTAAENVNQGSRAVPSIEGKTPKFGPEDSARGTSRAESVEAKLPEKGRRHGYYRPKEDRAKDPTNANGKEGTETEAEKIPASATSNAHVPKQPPAHVNPKTDPNNNNRGNQKQGQKQIWREKNRGQKRDAAIGRSLQDENAQLKGDNDALKEKMVELKEQVASKPVVEKKEKEPEFDDKPEVRAFIDNVKRKIKDKGAFKIEFGARAAIGQNHNCCHLLRIIIFLLFVALLLMGFLPQNRISKILQSFSVSPHRPWFPIIDCDPYWGASEEEMEAQRLLYCHELPGENIIRIENYHPELCDYVSTMPGVRRPFTHPNCKLDDTVPFPQRCFTDAEWRDEQARRASKIPSTTGVFAYASCLGIDSFGYVEYGLYSITVGLVKINLYTMMQAHKYFSYSTYTWVVLSFATLLIGLVFVEFLRVLYFWRETSVFENVYEFTHFSDDLHPDMRNDVMSISELKHRAMYAWVKYTSLKSAENEFTIKKLLNGSLSLWGFLFGRMDKISSIELKISMEMLAQLATADVFTPGLDQATVAARIIQKAKSIGTVNINRYEALYGNNIVQDTIRVCYGLYMQDRELKADLPFYSPQS